MTEIPATSYSTIFHCTQSGFQCTLRFCEGLVSVAMFAIFYRGYQIINKERNNKLTQEDKLLYQLAMWLTLMLAVYYLLFQEFFMLATIRNFLIWIGINVLHIFCLLYWQGDKQRLWIGRGMFCLQVVNFLLWLFVSLGEGSSLENADYVMGYNCEVVDWMLMSGILMVVNYFSAALGYFKINRLEWDIRQLREQDGSMNKRKIESAEREKINLMIIMGSGVIGSTIMFGWDFLAFNGAVNQQSCIDMFSGNTVFRNILTFLLKIFTMQLNPSAIYYVMYFCRKDEFQQSNNKELNEGMIDYWDDGASVVNRTNSSVRGDSDYMREREESSRVGGRTSEYESRYDIDK